MPEPSQSQAVQVLVYYHYLGGPGSQTVYSRRFYCGECRQRLHDPYHFPEYPDELERENESALGITFDPHRTLDHFAFCPWCGVQFEDKWWNDRTIQNERAIDHYRNPGTHKGDTHEFQGTDPSCMEGHWLSGGSEICWCDPEVEPGIMGCVIRHRAITREEYEKAERRRERKRIAAKRRRAASLVIPSEQEPGVIWLVETCDYDSYVSDTAVSVAAAIGAIKAPYGDPYVVEWEPPEVNAGGEWSLTGHFEPVPGFSTEHTATWRIYRSEVRTCGANSYPEEAL